MTDDFPLLSLQDLRARGISYSNVWLLELESRGEFPRRVRLSYKEVGWLPEQVDAWQARRRDQRAAAVRAAREMVAAA